MFCQKKINKICLKKPWDPIGFSFRVYDFSYSPTPQKKHQTQYDSLLGFMIDFSYSPKHQTQYDSLLGFMIFSYSPTKKKPWDPIWFSFRVYGFSHSALPWVASKACVEKEEECLPHKRKWWVWLANALKKGSQEGLSPSYLLFNVVGWVNGFRV